MKIGQIGKDILISLAVTLAVWMFFSWPLPRYAGHAIPCSAYNVEKGSMRMMMPGDNLQLLYQFWLADDTFKGGTPWFITDPYEFNTGNKSNETFYSKYYLPFSLFFAIGEVVGGQAVGYNFGAFLSLFLTYLFTWKLVRRYSKEAWISGVAAVLSIIFPYRWITMLDGSPTGLGMMWVPIIFWALDVMVSEKKMWAGALAGFGLYVSEWGDTHVFFFSVLSTPFWCAFSYLFHSGLKRPSRSEVFALLRASVFLVLFMGLVAFQVLRIKHDLTHSTIAGKGRSIQDVARCSLPLSGVVKFHNPKDSRKIYLGVYLILVLGAGWGAYYLARRRGIKSGLCAPLPLVLISVAVVGIVMLSVGVNNPGGFRAWKILVKVIPPYSNIRQADKIFCLLPVFLALGCGLLWPCILKFVPDGRRRFVSLALLVPLLLDYKYRIDATICGLDREQGAYRAVAEDARASGNKKPHIIVLPLWPGDSHFNSVNEYYISLYHLRMVNGYGGTTDKKYMEEIFLPLESMNIGGVYDFQLDELLRRGIGYVVLHEDTFPEKVSPFPVGYTLQKLMNHPRLECIGKDGAVWSFKILPSSLPSLKKNVDFLAYIFPSRRQEMEWHVVTNAVARFDDPSAIGGGYASLTVAGGCVSNPPTMAALDVPLHWLICARGTGVVAVSTFIDGVAGVSAMLDVDSANWIWRKVAIPAKEASVVLSAGLSLKAGAVDLDSMILSAGDWRSPAVGETLSLPAVCFFHAGYTEKDFKSVVFRRAYEPDGIVFYGPKLPLDKGKYSAEIVFESKAPAGTELGQFNVRWRGNEEQGWVLVTACSRAVCVFEQKNAQPFFLAFRYVRKADMRISRVDIMRIE